MGVEKLPHFGLFLCSSENPRKLKKKSVWREEPGEPGERPSR